MSDDETQSEAFVFEPDLDLEWALGADVEILFEPEVDDE